MTRSQRRSLCASGWLVSFSLILLFGLGACTTVAPPPAPKLPVPEWEAQALIETMKQRERNLRSVRALAQVSYSGPEGRHGFQEAVVVQRSDRLRLETLTMLGAVLIVTANAAEIIGYHPREGVFVRAQPTRENLRRYTQIPLELSEITMLLMGLPPVDSSASWRQEGNTLFFSANGQARDVLSFESKEPVPTRWERFDENGTLELSAAFGDYVATQAGWFPRAILLESPLQQKKLSMRYQEPEINPNLAEELFTQRIPAHAQEVPIEAVGS